MKIFLEHLLSLASRMQPIPSCCVAPLGASVQNTQECCLSLAVFFALPALWPAAGLCVQPPRLLFVCQTELGSSPGSDITKDLTLAELCIISLTFPNVKTAQRVHSSWSSCPD